VTGGKPIAVLLQSISDVNGINPLVAFYDIYGGKREVLFFFVPGHHTRLYEMYLLNVFFFKPIIKNDVLQNVCMSVRQSFNRYPV
jgi:hypothetical protein